MNAVIKPGRGRHGKRTQPDTRYSDETKQRAIKRFEEMAMPAAVSAELGVPYRTTWGWRQEWLKSRASNDDPGDQQEGC